MVFFEASGPLSIGKDLEFNGKKDGTKTEYQSCMRESSSERSRAQNFTMISHVEAGSEETASG